jgi:DNA-binding transcriptional LysR family regulator
VEIELRHLRAFVAVAEELNFTRAAERLHLAQPALSTQVRQLELRVGAPLFVRTTRKVQLSDAGHALLERVPGLLVGVDDAVRAARRAAEGHTGSLTVGLLATGPLDVTPAILRAFARERPHVGVSVRNVDFGDPSGGVRGGDADLAIVWLPFEDEGLVCDRLFDDHRMAVLAADHPLAARETLAVGDLLAEPMCWVEGVDPVAGAFWTLDEQRGGPPLIGAEVTGFEDMFAAVRAGSAFAAIPGSIAERLSFPDVAVREVAGLPPATVAICRRGGPEDPRVEIFAACAREVCAAD